MSTCTSPLKGAVVASPSLTSTAYWHGGAPGLKVGDWILRVLKAADDTAVGDTVRQEIAEFARAYPVPGIG